MRQSIAYDLAATDLADYDSLLRLVVAHTITPVRVAYGLPAPQANEGNGYFVEREERQPDGLLVQHIRPYRLKESVRFFDPVVRALLLFGWLFPGSVMPSEAPASVLRAPGWSMLLQSMNLLSRPHEAIAYLVGGLLGLPMPRPSRMGLTFLAAAPNPAAMVDLLAMQNLIGDALAYASEDPHTHLIDVGLQRVDPVAADQLDQVARSDVRRRYVWLGTYEFPDLDDSETASHLPETFERGVFAANLPESLKGLIALDFSEQLSYDLLTGRCALCGGLMEVDGRQRGRVRRREPVYHPECREEVRLAYWRSKSRERYRRVASANSSAKSDVTETA